MAITSKLACATCKRRKKRCTHHHLTSELNTPGSARAPGLETATATPESAAKRLRLDDRAGLPPDENRSRPQAQSPVDDDASDFLESARNITRTNAILRAELATTTAARDRAEERCGTLEDRIRKLEDRIRKLESQNSSLENHNQELAECASVNTQNIKHLSDLIDRMRQISQMSAGKLQTAIDEERALDNEFQTEMKLLHENLGDPEYTVREVHEFVNDVEQRRSRA